MDNEEIADLIAGREEDIKEWERWNAGDRRWLEVIPEQISRRERWIAESRARIAELQAENGE